MPHSTSLLRQSLFCLLCTLFICCLACKRDHKAPGPADTSVQQPAPEPEFYAGHSIVDSVGEITDRKAHYDTLLHILQDPFSGKDEFGPARKRLGHYGIDVSHYQSQIDWKLVKGDSLPHPIRFVFIKATQGKSMVDAHFKQNWEQAEKHNFRIGAYHFYRYKDDPLEQAANYIRNVPLTKGHLVPIVDVELDCLGCTAPEIPAAQIVANLKKYLGAIEAHYKAKPVIYTYEGFYNTYLHHHFPEHYFWMALYHNKPPQGWVVPKNNAALVEPKIALWQFTDSGKIPGIKGAVDMSFLIGKMEENVLMK